MVPLGLAQAATVRVAYQLGQQKPDRAGRAGFVAVVLGGLFMLGSAVVLWTVLRLLIGFYVELADPGNQALIAIALQLLVIAALFQLFDGVQVIASGALRGYRDTTIPMVIAAIGYWVSISSWLSFPGRKRSNICLFSSSFEPVITVPSKEQRCHKRVCVRSSQRCAVEAHLLGCRGRHQKRAYLAWGEEVPLPEQQRLGIAAYVPCPPRRERQLPRQFPLPDRLQRAV